MGVCTTVVKKLCRRYVLFKSASRYNHILINKTRHGIMRWPRRQLVALEASIEHLKMKPYASTEERDTIAAKLEVAKQTRHLLLTTGNGPQKSIKQLRRATTKLRPPNKSAPNPQNLLLLAQIATESSPDAANPTKTLP